MPSLAELRGTHMVTVLAVLWLTTSQAQLVS